MKKIITLILAIMMVVSSMGLFACGKGQVQAVDNPDVVLVDVSEISSYDLKRTFSSLELEKIELLPITYALTSVATGTKFLFEDSVIQISQIHKEYYRIEAFSEDKLVADGEVDFHDVNNDGVVWCEWSDYMLDACVVYASSDKVEFEYVDQSFGSDDVMISGDVLMYKPGIGRDWLNYIAIKPFHSKKYYKQFAPTGYMSISYVREAIYSYENEEFNPEEDPNDFGHEDGEFVAKGTTINSKVFGVKENSSLGNKLNQWQSVEYQMIQIIDHFDKIGDKYNGGAYWYFLGTCHYHHPYRISFYISSIDIIPS